MKLIGSRTSPYVRKVRVLLAERGIGHDFLEENAWTATTTVPRYNPLNKVPALQLDDGSCLYDSAVITEYLDAISGHALVPGDALQRARVRCLEALADGIADAGIAAFLERKREAPRQDAAWIARQMSKVDAGVAALAEALGSKPHLGGAGPDLADIAAACALAWLEFRMPEYGWRKAHPALDAWATRMAARPSFVATQPPAA